MNGDPSERVEIRRRSPLAERCAQSGGTAVVDRGWETVSHYTSPEEEVEAVRRSVGLADLSRIPKFDVRGGRPDTVPELEAKARIWPQRPGETLVTCPPESAVAVREQLDRYASAAGQEAPVYVSDVTAVYAALLLAGPDSGNVLGRLADIDASDGALPNLDCVHTGIHHVHAVVARQDLGSLPAYLILTGREYGGWLWDTVMLAGVSCGIRPFGSKAQQILEAAGP